MQFSWDARKAAANVRKHAVTFEEAVTVFADPLAVVVSDAVHDDRAVIIGESIMHRILLTVFAERSEDEVRIISARRATNHERRNYERGQKA